MKIYLRVAKEQNINISKNREFKSDENIHVLMYPIPDFIGEMNCSCGNKAILIINDKDYKCASCIDKILSSTKLVESSATSIPITRKTITSIKFEWSVNKERWYTLYGRGIKTNRWNYLIGMINKMVINNEDVELEGDYQPDETRKDKKKMVIL